MIRTFPAEHSIVNRQPSAKGEVGVRVIRRPEHLVHLDSDVFLVDGNLSNVYARKGAVLNEITPRAVPWQKKGLVWLRDHVNPNLPSMYYKAVLGHDLHISTYAELYMRQYHASERDPCDPTSYSMPGQATKVGRQGWVEDYGLVGNKKVTVVFRNFEVDALQGIATPYNEYNDYKFHRPGTGNTAESNADTGLVADTGLEATGTQTEGATADIYKSVATVTADTSETWAEHQIRSLTGAAGGTLMDRTVLSSTAVVIANDTVEFTYQITKNAEA